MIEEFDPNNIDNPLPNETFTVAQAIQAINRLLWSTEVEDDDYEDARVIKAFIVSVADEMAAMSTAHNSLHERYANALLAIDEWQDNFETVERASMRRLDEKIKLEEEIGELNAELNRRLHAAEKLREENEALRKANLNLIHAAHDNG